MSGLVLACFGVIWEDSIHVSFRRSGQRYTLVELCVTNSNLVLHGNLAGGWQWRSA